MRFEQKEKIIFLLSFGVKVLFGVLILTFLGKSGFLVGDSGTYLALAQNMAYHGVFSTSTASPYLPEAVNVPGYPLFLVLTMVFLKAPFIAVILQYFLLSLSAVLLYRMLKNFFPEKISFAGAVLFAVEPWNAFVSNLILSEALFMFLFIAGLYWFVRAIFDPRSSSTPQKTTGLPVENLGLLGRDSAPAGKPSGLTVKKWCHGLARGAPFIFASGFLLAAAVFVRPIILYLFPILAITFFLSRPRDLTSARLKKSFLLILIPALLIFSWSLRNYYHFGKLVFAAKGAYTFYFYDVEQLLEHRDKLSPPAAHDKLFQRIKEKHPEINSAQDLLLPTYSQDIFREGLKIISESPGVYLKLHLITLATFFGSDGYRLILNHFHFLSEPLPNITLLISQGRFGELSSYFVKNTGAAIVFIFGSVFWIAAAILAFASLYFAWRSGANGAPRASPWYRFFTVKPDGLPAGAESRPRRPHSSTGKPVVFWGVDKEKFAVLFFLLIIFYFAVLTGPAAQARYRVPITAFLFPLAVYTWYNLFTRHGINQGKIEKLV